jgi:imidazoleglycerol-phosphate dehydratase
VLDHLLGLLREYASFDLTCSRCAPGEAESRGGRGRRALGQALTTRSSRGLPRHGSAVVPVDEALATCRVEASGGPLVVSNVDLSDARVAGSRATSSRRFLRELAEGAD